MWLADIIWEKENERKWKQGDYLKALKSTLSAYDDTERWKPETAQMIYHLLKKEIDIINDKPENKGYQKVFSQWERLHKIKGLDIIEELRKRISIVNFKTNTGKAKFENTKERKDVEINNATIDGKGVYKILELLAKYNVIDKLNVNFLEGTTKATEGITINQEWIGQNEWIKLIKDRKTIIKKAKNKEEGRDPYEKMIIDMNSNLQNSEWPTSSTRMLYEICKITWLINKLPDEEKDTLERFVYFVDFAYRYKQKILWMDTLYIYGTLFGNYKKLRLWAIWGYLSQKTNPPKTGFESFTDEEAERILLLTKKTNENREKKIWHTSFKAIIKSKAKEITKAIKEIDRLEEVASLTYPWTSDGKYMPQTFIFDLENKIPLLEEAAPAREVWFVKLHKKNNEIYIRAYENLPLHFGGLTTENGNTGHFKLTAKNLETLLAEFTGDEEVKDQIREQFRVNNFPKLIVKEGEKFDGIIDKKAMKKEDNTAYGVKIKLTKEGNKPVRWLLHISNIKNIDELKKGETVKVRVTRVSERWISLKIVNEEAEKSLKVDEIVEGKITNINDKLWAFVDIGDTWRSWLIHISTGIDLTKVKPGDKVNVRIKSIIDDAKKPGEKRIGLEIAQPVKKLEIKKMNAPANNGLQEKISKLPKDLEIKTGMRLSWLIENIKEGHGAFVKVERNADGKKWRWGLLHIGKIWGDEALKKLSIGQEIDVVVKSLKDEKEKRINFGLIKLKSPLLKALKKLKREDKKNEKAAIIETIEKQANKAHIPTQNIVDNFMKAAKAVGCPVTKSLEEAIRYYNDMPNSFFEVFLNKALELAEKWVSKEDLNRLQNRFNGATPKAKK